MTRRTFRQVWTCTACVTCGQEFIRHADIEVPECLDCRMFTEFSARVAQQNATHVASTRGE